MTANWTATPWSAPSSHHAEGPLWDERHQRLYWVDQYAGLLRSAATEGGQASEREPVSLGAPVGAIVPDSHDGWLLALGNGFSKMDPNGRLQELVGVLPDDGVKRRMNDGKCDPLGRFWAGSMAFDKTPGAGTLYVLERGVVRVAMRDRTISNGMAWTPDGTTMYYIDTPTRRVDRFHVTAHGTIEPDGVLARIPDGAGSPDGMCIDADGSLWVALWGGGMVHRYSPTGEHTGTVIVDAPQVSSCAFGGSDLGTLFITTSREEYSPAEQERHPQAGAVFAVRTGSRGLPVHGYRE